LRGRYTKFTESVATVAQFGSFLSCRNWLDSVMVVVAAAMSHILLALQSFIPYLSNITDDLLEILSVAS
ncbi:hypothetical protein AAER80_24165, partial [Klebsiella pneumoniae]|uniref:hypothetical protein n=1 Tax=Klebsiella pneumoniae TaxID=573 RepID=UPI00273124B5